MCALWMPMGQEIFELGMIAVQLHLVNQRLIEANF